MSDIKDELKAIISNAIRYWEFKRLIYNGILIIITLFNFFLYLPDLKSVNYLGIIVIIFILAMIANILYCAAYIVDVFIQLSDFQPIWFKYRWMLFLLGTILASLLASFYSIFLFRI